MPVMTFKAKDAPTGYTPIPDGTYLLEIEKVDPNKVSKTTKVPQMQVTCKVVEGPYIGKTATIWAQLAGKGAWVTRAILDATGVDYEVIESDDVDEEGNKLNDYSFDTDDLPGTSMYADTFIDEYEGNKNNKWKNFKAVEADEAPKDEKPAAAAKGAEKAAASKAAAPAAASAPVRRVRQ